MDLYDRQKNLDLKIPESVTVVGCGGIGSWVALNMALIGVKRVALVDYDLVEEHNLNRTPFKMDQVGDPKVYAVQELIMERRDDVDIHAFHERYEELDPVFRAFTDNTDLIVDCRDTVKEKICGSIKLGYDGFNYTVDPSGGANVWGEGDGYSVVPSFLGTPQFLAAVFVCMVVCDDIRGGVGSVKEIIKKL